MSGLGYTLPAVAAVVVVVLLELAVLRTGLFTRAGYWISMVIVIAFQVLVDGWLTRLDAPIVVYDDHQTLGVRFPWDIPVEDFAFGWAMVTAVLLLWVRAGDRARARDAATARVRADVPRAFDTDAPSYDALVARDPGYHADLLSSARRLNLPDGGRGMRLLDAGCGTGASTAALLTVAPHAEIVAVDGSAGMLARAREKPWPATVRFVHCYVDQLSEHGVHGPFDAVFAAYLVRNVDDADHTLKDFRNLLRPGGTLALHEYSVRDSLRARVVWNLVSTLVIVPLARLRGDSGDLQRYLRVSVNQFDGAERLRGRLRDTGFDDVRSASPNGWQHGVVHTFLARAPR